MQPYEIRGVGVSIDAVTKIFTTKQKRFRALDPISIDIEPGEFVSFVGPSGCGKSTLMLMVAGLIASTEGEVRIAGAPVTEPYTDIGIAFQDHLLLDFRTAMDNVMLQAQVRNLDKRAIRAAADGLFEQLKIAHAADRYPNQLSGGMRQRVSIARSLVHNPPLLLMDEPLGALDALTRLEVRSDLERLWMEHRPTVLFITHSVDEAVSLSDRVIVLSPGPGRIVEEVTIPLPRPRPMTLGDSPELLEYAEHIYSTFRAVGVLHDA